MDIGERIKTRRKEIGLSAEQVADQLKVSPATIYRYESSDIANMRIDKLEPIAKVLKTTPAYLMGWEDKKENGLDNDDPEELIISKEELKNIENKMNELLSDLELEVLELYLSGKSYQYIANMLNRDVKSIDNALQRVKRKLEKHLENRNN